MIALLTLSLTTEAALTYNIDANGKLSGINNLDVGGVLYNVSLVEGSFNSIWGLDGSPDFALSEVAANALADALKSPLAEPYGVGLNPSLVHGIYSQLNGVIIIPDMVSPEFQDPLYDFIHYSFVGSYGFNNNQWTAFTGRSYSISSWHDTSLSVANVFNYTDTEVYAKFAPVPIPMTILLFGSALAGIGLLGRNRESHFYRSML